MKKFIFNHGVAVTLILVISVAACFSPLRLNSGTGNFFTNSWKYIQAGDVPTLIVFGLSIGLFAGFIYEKFLNEPLKRWWNNRR